MAENKKNVKSKGSRTLTIAFYTVYFVMIISILAGIYLADRELETWLADYEASLPDSKRDEIFQANFADPDWEQLYSVIGLADTDYEGSEAFVSYMQAKVGDQELHWEEAPGEYTEGLQYLVKAGNETIGYFTMVDRAPAGSRLADWQLDQVVILHGYDASVTICKGEDVTVFVNGTALTDDHTIRITATKADAFLPMGQNGPRTYTQHLEGLMVAPEVTARDAEGNELAVTYDALSGIYTVQTEQALPITEDEQKLAQEIVKMYALAMIGQAVPEELEQHFDPIPWIFEAEPWMAAENVSTFHCGEAQLTDFCRYNEDLFSARGSLELTVTDPEEASWEFKVDLFFLFEKQGEDLICINITAENILEEVSLVRLSFLVGDTMIYSNLFQEDVEEIIVPIVSAPAGQVFTGWYLREATEDGSEAYTLVFQADESGIMHLPEGNMLVPMVLHAGFEDAAQTGG